MNRDLVKQWNKKCSKNDTMIHAGDMFMLNSSNKSFNLAKKIIDLLEFKELLIIPGNHDKKLWKWIKSHKPSFLEDKRIVICDQIHEINTVDSTGLGIYFVICHYPILTWNKRSYNSIQLHGHTHSYSKGERNTPRRINIGVDAWGMMPVEEKEIIEYIKTLLTIK